MSCICLCVIPQHILKLSVQSTRTHRSLERSCVARQHDESARFLVDTSVALHPFCATELSEHSSCRFSVCKSLTCSDEQSPATLVQNLFGQCLSGLCFCVTIEMSVTSVGAPVASCAQFGRKTGAFTKTTSIHRTAFGWMESPHRDDGDLLDETAKG